MANEFIENLQLDEPRTKESLVLKLYNNRKFQKVQESLRKSTFSCKNVV